MTYLLYILAAIEVLLVLYALYNIKKLITTYREDENVYYYISDKLENVLEKVRYSLLLFLR